MFSFLLSAIQSAKIQRLLTGVIIVGSIGAETGLLVLNRFVLSGAYFGRQATEATSSQSISEKLGTNLSCN